MDIYYFMLKYQFIWYFLRGFFLSFASVRFISWSPLNFKGTNISLNGRKLLCWKESRTQLTTSTGYLRFNRQVLVDMNDLMGTRLAVFDRVVRFKTSLWRTLIPRFVRTSLLKFITEISTSDKIHAAHCIFCHREICQQISLES